MMHERWYIGHAKDGSMTAFKTELKGSVIGYFALTGPFRTKRAALWAEKHGRNNPHFQHINDAERLSKLVA